MAIMIKSDQIVIELESTDENEPEIMGIIDAFKTNTLVKKNDNEYEVIEMSRNLFHKDNVIKDVFRATLRIKGV